MIAAIASITASGLSRATKVFASATSISRPLLQPLRRQGTRSQPNSPTPTLTSTHFGICSDTNQLQHRNATSRPSALKRERRPLETRSTRCSGTKRTSWWPGTPALARPCRPRTQARFVRTKPRCCTNNKFNAHTRIHLTRKRSRLAASAGLRSHHLEYTGDLLRMQLRGAAVRHAQRRPLIPNIGTHLREIEPKGLSSATWLRKIRVVLPLPSRNG